MKIVKGFAQQIKWSKRVQRVFVCTYAYCVNKDVKLMEKINIKSMLK